jgi:hypothetical protein
MRMKRRFVFWSFAALAVVAAPAIAAAQSGPASAPIGKWRGAMQGFGDLTLTVTGIKANGKIEGQLNFSGPNYTFVFGDAINKGANPEVGTAEMVEGQLVITAPQGGVYKLTPAKTQMNGSFSRGPIVGTLTLDKAG